MLAPVKTDQRQTTRAHNLWFSRSFSFSLTDTTSNVRAHRRIHIDYRRRHTQKTRRRFGWDEGSHLTLRVRHGLKNLTWCQTRRGASRIMKHGRSRVWGVGWWRERMGVHSVSLYFPPFFSFLPFQFYWLLHPKHLFSCQINTLKAWISVLDIDAICGTNKLHFKTTAGHV